jgi:amidase
MVDLSFPFPSAQLLASDLRTGALTSVEALEMHLKCFESRNGRLNAIVRTDIAAARTRARELDRMQKDGRLAGPLHGVPLTLKDTFDVDGMPAVAGAPELVSRPNRTADSAIAAQLKAAGAIIWGKSNTPYLAGDSQTYNAVYGLTRNPWDLKLTPGGSSGGAAVALAAGMTPLEVGSDIGGSLRIPAHFCGVAALKTTFGRVSLAGHVPPQPGVLATRDLNVAGPMARTVDDLMLLLSVLAPASDFEDTRRDIDSLPVGLWSESTFFPLSGDCRQAVEIAADSLRDLGYGVVRARPDITDEELLDLYLRLLLPILALDMPRPLARLIEASRPLASLFGRTKTFSRSRWLRYSGGSHREWLLAHDSRLRLKVRMQELFSKRSVLIAPVFPTTAFPHDQSGDSLSRTLNVDGRPYFHYLSHGWIALSSLCHLPSVVIPTPRSPGSPPCGIQIIGPEGGDLTVLRIAKLLEAHWGRPPSPPPLADWPTFKSLGTS